MPFKSLNQKRKLYATNPMVAQEFEAKTPKAKKLPLKVKAKVKKLKAKKAIK